MNRGRGRQIRGRSSPMRWSPRPRDNPHPPRVEREDLSSSNSSKITDGRRTSQQVFVPCEVSKGSEGKHVSRYPKLQFHDSGKNDGFINVVKHQQEQNSKRLDWSDSAEPSQDKHMTSISHSSGDQKSDIGRNQIGLRQDAGEEIQSSATLHSDISNGLNIIDSQPETQLPLESVAVDAPPDCNNPNSTTNSRTSEHLDPTTKIHSYDICCSTKTATVVLKPSLLVKNRERRNETRRNMEGIAATALRPGMVLLKSYIPLGDQIKIVKACRDLGNGIGGFYEPGYRDGAKLHLRMMCLGKNWDPQTNKYGDHRPIDGAKPPDIPSEFCQLVEKALRDSHDFFRQNSKVKNPEKILPWMIPDICIVNFYSNNGRLGLHQDRDESQESLRKGLPVVSFSIGNKADFLYGDQRDVDKAEKVTLESGDVLIFGGESRHVFHGVTDIHPDSAPKLLLEETNLRDGRLNLTFREY